MKIKEIHLQTSKLDELKVFYGDILKFKLDISSSDSLIILANQSRIQFQQTDISDPFYHFAFNIPSNKIDEACNWLQQKVALIWLPDFNSYIADFKNWNAKSLYFKDPAGNIVEFIARLNLNDHESSEFSSDQIRNVSEIGFVFPEEIYTEKISAILSEYSLSYFPLQPPQASFKVIGEEEGLFICVPKGRAWYPTVDEWAGIYPIIVLFDIAGKDYFFKFN